MQIMASYYTDVGSVKKTNQDSLCLKIVNLPNDRVAFAVVCDGMGGLERGELASKEVVLALERWFFDGFARMVSKGMVTENQLYIEWEREVALVNQKLMEYGNKHGIQLGTTLTVLLVFRGNYYICHIGDSRLYKITKQITLITEDHTVAGHELRMGLITAEQAKNNPRRNMLVQCVGASAVIEPQMVAGVITEETTFILCSDGFVHCLSAHEMYESFKPELLKNKDDVTDACEILSRLVIERGEQDNVTVIGIVLKDIESKCILVG